MYPEQLLVLMHSRNVCEIHELITVTSKSCVHYKGEGKLSLHVLKKAYEGVEL